MGLTRAAFARVLLAVALATATVVHEGLAQCITNFCPPPPPSSRPGPPPGGGDDNRAGWLIVGGVLGVIVGAAITKRIFPDPQPGGDPAPSTLPPDQTLTQVQLPPPSSPTPPAPAAGPTAPAGPASQALRRGFDLPPLGAPCVPNEALVEATASQATLAAIAARNGMTPLETVTIRLTGRTLHRWRIDDGTPVPDMGRRLSSAERQLTGFQCNSRFELAQAETAPANADQYAPQKINLVEAHHLARGNRVLIAVIDSEVDVSHPDLAGAIAGSFEASADDERPHSHGTGMAGAIAAHHTMLGVAPQSALLTVRAFSSRANTVEGTTFNILKGLDWAADKGARVVNMSFAGPSDPRLREAFAKANKKGMVLIAAAGNAGPKSPPLFPAADPNVIAVTATDSNDALFTGANRGNHIAVAAPGVDILVPAPDGTYQFTTGTSVAAAEVSGAAALLLERNPALTPAAVRKILMDTAKDLGPRGRDRDFGAGLIDALRAVSAVR